MASAGFFSGFWSRLRAAASGLTRKGGPPAGDDDDAHAHNQGDEATVRSRLARRATNAARVGRNLAFVSFNLEVLVFVYALWRARRRNLSWRQPIQALPMLVIPALATLIYAAFIRFTRTLDLIDKKTLERLQEEKQADDCVPREFDQNEQNSARVNVLPSLPFSKCDLVGDASHFSAETSELGKHHQPSINLRDDGGDMSWGHSKDFQPLPSDGLRRRRLSIEKAYMTNSSSFSQQINWSSEHLADGPEDPHCMRRTVEPQINSGADVAENGMAYSSVETSSCLPGCSIVHINSNASDRAECNPPVSSPKSSGGLAEEDAVQITLIGPKSNLPAFAGLLHEEVEEKESSKFHASEENRMSFISEKELLVSPSAVKKTEHRLGTSGFTLCSQETEKEDVAGGACFIKVSPELSFLSSPELIVEGTKVGSEKESCELNTQEENDAVVNSEEEALLGPHVANTAEQCSGTSRFLLCCQDSNMMEIPAILDFFAVSSESNHPATVESLAEDDENSKEDGTSDVHLMEQKGQEAFLDPLAVDSYEYSSATSEFFSHSEAAKMTEVPGAVNEDLSESQDDGASNNQNDVVATSDDGGNTENMMGVSESVQLIPEAKIMEALQCGQETLSDPLHHSSFHSAGIFLSSSEISNDEAYSSKSNSCSLFINSMEEVPLTDQRGRSESKDEMNFAFLDTPILLNEVTKAESWTDNAGCSQCIPDSDRTQSLHNVKRAPSKTSDRANFDLGESLISPDQEINSEIFSLYSRSSSCVSEVNMMDTLRGCTFPEPGNGHDFSQHASPESQLQDPSSFKEAFFYPDELCVAENNPDNAKSSLCSAEINLIELLDSDQRVASQQQDGTNLGFEDIYIPRQGATSENRFKKLGYEHITDANMAETLQGAEILSSKILHDGSIAGTSAFLDGGNSAENSSNNSGSSMHTEINTEVILDLQEGLFKPQDETAMVSISQYEVDSAETNCSNHTYTEETMAGAVQRVNKPPSHSQDEHPGTCISLDKGNNATIYSDYSGSSSSMPNDDLIKIQVAGPEGSFEPNDGHPPSIEETSISENSSSDPTSASHTSMNQSVRSYVKGLPDPLREDIDRFNKIPGDEKANTPNENGLSCKKIAITQADVNYTESQDCTEASNLNCPEASQSVNEGFFEPEHQGGPELVRSQVRMPLFIDEGKETEKDSGGSSTASSHHEISILESLQELPIAAGSEKGFPEGEVCESDKDPKDLEIDDMKEDIEDLDEDHENNPIGLLEAAEITPGLAQKPSVKLYAKDASWRDLAMGMSNDFEVAQVAGLRQRKPIFTITSSTGSSTVPELADMQYTEPTDDDTNPFSAPLPSSVAPNIQNRSNETACISVECSPTEQPRKSI